VLLAVVFHGERLDRRQISGLALAITAAALLS
jgi:drug/metabolite transporter (DMT)-like permease